MRHADFPILFSFTQASSATRGKTCKSCCTLLSYLKFDILCMDAGRSRFARRELADGMKLEEVVKNAKPTVLLGLSGAPKVCVIVL